MLIVAITLVLIIAAAALLSGLTSVQTLLERTGPPRHLAPPPLWPITKDTGSMRKKRIAALEMVTPGLRATEMSVDAALIQAARFTVTLLEAHQISGLATTVGHDAFSEAAGAFETLAAARSRIVQTHLRLGEVKTQIGLATHMAGNGGDKPDDSVIASTERGLRVVA